MLRTRPAPARRRQHGAPFMRPAPDREELANRVAEFRRHLCETQQLLLTAIGYHDGETGEWVDFGTYADEIDHLWMLWRSWFPDAAPPPQLPIRCRRDSHHALDALRRRLEELFGPADLPPPTPELKPSWNRSCRQLKLGGDVIYEYKRLAPTQFPLLDAFEKAGWPAEGIGRPRELDGEKVKNAVDALNEALLASRLRFHHAEHHNRIHYRITA